MIFTAHNKVANKNEETKGYFNERKSPRIRSRKFRYFI